MKMRHLVWIVCILKHMKENALSLCHSLNMFVVVSVADTVHSVTSK